MPESTEKSYSQEFGPGADSMTPEQMVAAMMKAVREIADNTRAMRDIFEGTDEEVGLVEFISDMANYMEAADAAFLGIMEEEKRFTPAEFLRRYRDIRVDQEEEPPDNS